MGKYNYYYHDIIISKFSRWISAVNFQQHKSFCIILFRLAIHLNILHIYEVII